MTLADTIKTLLVAEWSFETTPTFVTTDYAHDTDFELFDANIVSPQVCINSETERETLPVVDSIYRVVHKVKILVYVKPCLYNATELTAAKTIFDGIIADIDTILRANRFLITGVVDATLTGWKTLTQKKKEPIIFQAAQTVKCLYYEG